jgi:hypothetical protein
MTNKSKRQNGDRTVAAVLADIETEGVRSAYNALKAVCDDPNAPANAKATAGATIFRAAGLLETAKRREGGKELHEMTLDELEARIRKAEEGAQGDEGDVDIFE